MNAHEHPTQQQAAARTHRREFEDQVLAAADRFGDQAHHLIRETAASIREHRAADQQRYRREFQRAAGQLATDELADQWQRMDVNASAAAEWANAGFLPGEARRHLAAGRTPVEAAEHQAAGWPIESLNQVADAMRHELTNHPEADRPRLTRTEAVDLTTIARATHDDPAVRKQAQRLLDRYNTIAGVGTVHDADALDPDKLHDVVEEMRRLIQTQRHRIEQAAETAAAELRAHTALDQLTSRQTSHQHTTGNEQYNHRAAARDTGACHE